MTSARPKIPRAALGLVAGLLLLPARADARPEDLKREISTQQRATDDLAKLDDKHAAEGEIALQRSWLDEAWGQLAKEEYDRVRELLDRCIAQAELIRQKAAAAHLAAQAVDREIAVKATREKNARLRKAIEQALEKKRSLEATVR
jgi:hypothetical protein